MELRYIGTDRTHNLQVSHTYDIPNVGKYFAFKPVGAVLGNWEFSGITEVQSGAPSNPGCGLTQGSPTVTGGYTGTPDVSQRCEVIGDPLSVVRAGRYFNASAFAMPALATGPNNSIVGPPALGNLGGGAGVLRYPMVTNFDVTLTKIVPLGSEKRLLKFQAQAYNVFNHPEFNAENTGIQFGPTTNPVTNLNATGLPTNTVAGSNRIMAFSARLEFQDSPIRCNKERAGPQRACLALFSYLGKLLARISSTQTPGLLEDGLNPTLSNYFSYF